MIEVPLRDGKVALIDDMDESLAAYRWYLRPNGYVMRFEGPRGSQRRIRLAREVMGVSGQGVEVDHVDRDPLNNRRSNLRVVSHAENMQNQGSRPGSASEYRGVSRDQRRGKWIAKVKFDYRSYWLGYHEVERDAARASEAFRRAHMPFAVADLSLDPLPPCRCGMAH